MDGQYGNVSFICTQTDDCEPTEICRDHSDVAEQIGLRDRMTELMSKLDAVGLEEGAMTLQLEERRQPVEELKRKFRRAEKRRDQRKEEAKGAQKIYKQLENGEELEEEEEQAWRSRVTRQSAWKEQLVEARPWDDDEDEEEEEEAVPLMVESAKEAFMNAKEAYETAKGAVESIRSELDGASATLKQWQDGAYSMETDRIRRERNKLTRELKPLCAKVRNAYSTRQLQADFRAGLEELCRQPDEEELDDSQGSSSAAAPAPKPLPEDYEMDVHCISANDFLKLRGVKNRSDGPPSCYNNAEDTGIPNLRSYVHKTTARRREAAAHAILHATSDFLSELKLYMTDNGESLSAVSSAACEAAFQTEVGTFSTKATAPVEACARELSRQVQCALVPAVQTGAERGKAVAKETVASWGSKDRRTKDQHNGGGLFWGTYFPTVRRDGVYTSGSCGSIDFNQELCDPVEKSFMVGWEQTMNAAVSKNLKTVEGEIQREMKAAIAGVKSVLQQRGLTLQQIQQASETAGRVVETLVRDDFRSIGEYAKESQRSINRQLLPEIQQRMKPGYEGAVNTERGLGRFMRMKNAVESHSSNAIHAMFREATKALLDAISALINELNARMSRLLEKVVAKLSEVFSVCWEREVSVDPATQLQVRRARDAAIHKMAPMRERLDTAMEAAGIAREEEEVEMTDVRGADERREEAQRAGLEVDLTGDDDDAEAAASSGPTTAHIMAVANSGTAHVEWTYEPGTDRMNIEFKAFALYVKKHLNGEIGATSGSSETKGTAIAAKWNELGDERREHYLRRALNVPGEVMVTSDGSWVTELREEE